MDKTYFRCDDLLSLLTEKVFGTIWVNKKDWYVPEDKLHIGRQFFYRRCIYPEPINAKTMDNLLLLYNYALNGNSIFQPDKICSSFLSILNAVLGVNLQYLRFATDDTEKLRTYKINAILDILTVTLQCNLNQSDFNREQLAHTLPAKIIENYKLLIKYSKGTTEGILRQTVVYGLNDYIDELIDYGISLPEIDGALQKQDKNTLEKEIWYASQRSFLSSCEKNGRFHGVTVISNLLPKGINVNLRLPIHLNALGNTSISLKDIFHNNTNNISIIGEGGIGKTTFLQHILLEEYVFDDGSAKAYTDGSIIPIFIELNRCPEMIQDWISSVSGKSNFITRYIAHILENHSSLETVDQKNIEQIEKDMQKIPSDGKKKYLLLLDGFNEVRLHSDLMIRTTLSNEIQALRKYPNVRIITTSRQTQEYKYAESFQGVYLSGLEKEDITDYLANCNYSNVEITRITANTLLMACLRVPLYLCMFCAQKWNLPILPETPGEILNLFFHKNTSFYNMKKHTEEIKTSFFSEHQTIFVLNFIIPYIGWHYEEMKCFSINKATLKQLITEAVSCTIKLFGNTPCNPYSEFEYDPALLLTTAYSLSGNDNMAEDILNYICNYFGIFYRYQTNSNDFSNKYHYGFIHHNFRDYFSAMWDIQLLSLLRCISPEDFYADTKDNVHCHFMDNNYWTPEKASLISQILMEHHSKPLFNESTGNWFLPEPIYDEQKILPYSIDFCRKMVKAGEAPYHLLNNILTALHLGRGELSGMNLSCLDFRKFNFFGIICSKKGLSKTLSADFTGSSFALHSFLPENHQSFIEEHIYCDKVCYTIDSYGIVKCWDILSGKMEYEIVPPIGHSHFTDAYNSSVRHLKVSKGGKWIAIRVKDTTDDKEKIVIYDSEDPTSLYDIIETSSDRIMGFDFTDDSSAIFVLYDHVLLFCFSLLEKKELYYIGIPKHYTNTTISAETPFSDIYFIGKSTALRDYYRDVIKKHKTMPFAPSIKLSAINQELKFYESHISDDEDCVLSKLAFSTGEYTIYSEFENLHEYGNIATFLADCSCFVYYDDPVHQIKRCNCKTGIIDVILENITFSSNDISAVYAHPTKRDTCYFISYSDVFEAKITASTDCKITAHYNLDSTNSQFPTTGFRHALVFSSSTAPYGTRFLLQSRESVYEWESESNRLTLKYNPSDYRTIALIPDLSHNHFILVHRTNGISIFGSTPYRLINYFHLEKADYNIEKCCYHEKNQMLAVTLQYLSHRKVVICNIQNSKQDIVFETFKEMNSINQLCFNDYGDKLLIVCQYTCMEYDMTKKMLSPVCQASANEKYACGNYSDSKIEIAIAQDNGTSPAVTPRCDQYISIKNSSPTSFYKCSFYYLPEITEKTREYFIPLSNNCGGISYDRFPSAENYIYRGLILQNEAAPKELYGIDIHDTHGKTTNKKQRQIEPYLDIIYVAVKGNASCPPIATELTSLSDDHKKTIIYNHLYFSYCSDLTKEHTVRDISANGYFLYASPKYKTWIHAIPWKDNMIIGCRDENRIFTLSPDQEDDIRWHFVSVGSEIKYSPGIAICGCDFSCIVCDTDTKKIIHQNGGLLDANSIPEGSEEYSIHKYFPRDIERTMKTN